MMLPAPPPEFVKVEDLVVGKQYHVDSSMGGVYTMTYMGRVTETTQEDLGFKMYVFQPDTMGKHLFFHDPKDSCKLGYMYTDERVVEVVSVIRKFATLEEWRAAGGSFPFGIRTREA